MTVATDRRMTLKEFLTYDEVSEYRAIGIPEYWIVDPAPFGAVA
jgi:hypothetical protein